MSEYQYYEFQTIDRPLTSKEQAEIRELSSRVKMTPTQAIFLYNYGSFHNKPEEVLTKYFDAISKNLVLEQSNIQVFGKKPKTEAQPTE